MVIFLETWHNMATCDNILNESLAEVEDHVSSHYDGIMVYVKYYVGLGRKPASHLVISFENFAMFLIYIPTGPT